MPGGGDDDLKNAHASFRSAASGRLKRLMAEGVEGGAASSQLFDELLEHRAESGPSSPSLHSVMERTGVNPVHASKILLLKEEIGRLRVEGHSTPALIEQLQRRLREGGQRPAGLDENREQASARRTPGSAASKKRRVGDEGAVTSLAPPRLQELPDYDDFVPYRQPPEPKRGREEGQGALAGSPLSQLKKLKQRPRDGRDGF